MSRSALHHCVHPTVRVGVGWTQWWSAVRGLDSASWGWGKGVWTVSVGGGGLDSASWRWWEENAEVEVWRVTRGDDCGRRSGSSEHDAVRGLDTISCRWGFGQRQERKPRCGVDVGFEKKKMGLSRP